MAAASHEAKQPEIDSVADGVGGLVFMKWILRPVGQA